MAKSKGERGEEVEKGEKGEKGEKEMGERIKKVDKTKKTNARTGKGRKTEIPKKEETHEEEKEEDLSALLKNALDKFPEPHDPDKSEKQDDDDNITTQESKPIMEDFEKLFKTQLKDATGRAKSGQDNLFHVMVKTLFWPKTAKEKAFLNWMLKQQEHHHLLNLPDVLVCTPMHHALFNKLYDFVNCVLAVKELNMISILGQKGSAGNCLHVATGQSFPNLEDMIKKCAGDKKILMGDDNTPENTPLHIAVQQVLVPVKIKPVEDDIDQESEDGTEKPDNNDDEHSQQNHERDGVLEDSDDDDEDYRDSESEVESESSLEHDEEDQEHDVEAQELEPVRYRLETKPERETRLKTILKNLDKAIVRPTPPSRTKDTKLNAAQHLGSGEAKNGLPEEGDTLSTSQDTLTQDVMELPLDHSVRLLVEECPETLTTKNVPRRTPYQEREYILLKDETVKKLVKEYAEKKVRRGGTEEVREARAKREIVVKDPVAHYIRSFCVRKSKSREETMKRLYKPGQECHIEFDLGGFPTPVIKLDYLEQLEKHLKFESILKYVALPILSVEAQPVKGPRSQSTPPSETQSELHRKGRSDLVAVFDWLWRRGVREIIKVMVVDDGDIPHANDAIVEALYGFKVEEWDWKRVDLCSDVIYESSPAVREVSLYSSGNNAVLMGWASAEGLGNREKFPHLEKVNLFVQEGLEDKVRWNWNNNCCKENIRKYGGKAANGVEISVEIIDDNKPVKRSSELSTTEKIEEAPAWIKSVRDFSTFLMNASMSLGKDKQVPPVKIAIIDDGIDATMYDLQSKIAGGATFCPYPLSPDLVNSYFVPRGKHGTLMAQLICSMCPSTQLYIARLEELPTLTGAGRRVTARSAAKAVDWAVSCNVNIISMSWTIQTAVKGNEDMRKLEDAIGRAHAAKILMFCSASDQGANNTEACYPGDWNQCIRIGGATFTGEKLTWVDKNVDFWFPGRNVPFPSKDGLSVVYESGSSVATAAASGLAGVLIYSARLLDRTLDDKNNPFQDKKTLVDAFGIMANGSDGKFPRTDDALNKFFKIKIQGVTKKSSKNIDIDALSWTKESGSAEALQALLNYLQRL
ncbi:putative subtilisin [Mollisia scopiformis]|uniref:Putative subtilisin n=1 Tax=Mollisia scopiformis TaxID=149040 RepID=A0A194X5B1_MOLSC|nr:putative subtilisin [Mollisia scopiformis]KUJ15360.1 putative subtilisin [Mollisia scopiformis]